MLDISCPRVTAHNNVFDKARLVSEDNPNALCVIVVGRGVYLQHPTLLGDDTSLMRLRKFAPDTQRVEVEAALNTPAVSYYPLLSIRESDEAGLFVQRIPDLELPPAPGQPVEKNNKQALSMSDILNTIDQTFGLDTPVVVLGYTQMIRGNSFRSNGRVPTHIIQSLGAANSIEKMVQACGRGTYQGKEQLFANGFDQVRVLMTEADFSTLIAYSKFVDELVEKIKEGGEAPLTNALSAAAVYSRATEPLLLSRRFVGAKRLNLGRPVDALDVTFSQALPTYLRPSGMDADAQRSLLERPSNDNDRDIFERLFNTKKLKYISNQFIREILLRGEHDLELKGGEWKERYEPISCYSESSPSQPRGLVETTEGSVGKNMSTFEKQRLMQRVDRGVYRLHPRFRNFLQRYSIPLEEVKLAERAKAHLAAQAAIAATATADIDSA